MYSCAAAVDARRRSMADADEDVSTTVRSEDDGAGDDAVRAQCAKQAESVGQHW